MKTSMMALLALALTSTAHAGYYQVLETCTADNSGPDHGITVTVTSYHGSRLGGNEQAAPAYATITEETIAGPVELGSYEVTFKPATAISYLNVGSYVGNEFSLILLNAPTRGGQIGDLTAVGNQPNHTNVKINERLHCNDAPNL